MKIQCKLLLIFILFLVFIMFKNDCFAESTIYTSKLNNGETITLELPEAVLQYKYIAIYAGFQDLNKTDYNYSLFFSNSEMYFCYTNSSFRSTDCLSVKTADGSNLFYYWGGLNSQNNISLGNLDMTRVTSMSSLGNSIAINGSRWQAFGYGDFPFSNYDFTVLRRKTGESYSVSANIDNSSYFVDKLNLYELNLTDLDYNSQTHKFNLATYTNSPCYDEIMEYYNKDYQYMIYLTDYERILTYQDYDDDNSFLYGSYVISGYIDYLITDKAFFYYSEYYNQVLSNSGNSVFNKDKENYTKRFYFKLTYSEDSNDPHAQIWEENGNLYKIDYLENFEARYFVGSSQTIYYANENAKGNFKDLTKDIYYLGYLNPTGGKTRDISEIPFYVYNFDYAGGSTELYVVNQNDYNYEEMINSRYDNWKEHYDKWTILTDGSTGGSYAQGNDLTSSTFLKGDVTDDTTTEDDKSHIGEIRTPFGDVEKIDEKKETENTIKDGTLITDTVNKIKNKFVFSNNIVNNANEIKDYIVNTQETHKYYLNINHKYLSGRVCIIDLSWYEEYKSTVDAFICAFAYLAFIWQMFCKIPNLISGVSASSYLADIQTYKETGFGRSSNIHKGGF